MERRFWLERWSKNQIGFHQAAYNPWLLKYGQHIVNEDGCVFVPMCGKSLDMRWLAERCSSVVGIELAEIAIKAFFAEAGEAPKQRKVDELVSFSSPDTTIYCGDYFDLTADNLKTVTGVFDRGALVAMPVDTRRRYVDHMLRVLPEKTNVLLVTIEYDQALVAGPPFCVLPEEVQTLFATRCRVETLERQATAEVPPHFQAQGVTSALEAVYLITKHS